MKNCKRIEIMIATAALLIVSAVYQPANAQTLEPRATKVRIAIRDRDIYGALFVTIAGTEQKVTEFSFYYSKTGRWLVSAPWSPDVIQRLEQ